MVNHKTFVVGDTHLHFAAIKPLLMPLIKERRPKEIIFVGDYLDQWYQNTNDALYESELNALVAFKRDMLSKGITVTYLIGNHDVIYLTGHADLVTYSNKSLKVQALIRRRLKQMDCKLSAKSNGYLISHAGFAGHSKAFGLRKLPSIKELSKIADPNRATLYDSCLWIRPDALAAQPSIYYPKQIFGHTPVSTVSTISSETDLAYYDVDTFSLNAQYQPQGDGSILELDQGEVQIIKTDWLKINHAASFLYHLGFI